MHTSQRFQPVARSLFPLSPAALAVRAVYQFDERPDPMTQLTVTVRSVSLEPAWDAAGKLPDTTLAHVGPGIPLPPGQYRAQLEYRTGNGPWIWASDNFRATEATKLRDGGWLAVARRLLPGTIAFAIEP